MIMLQNWKKKSRVKLRHLPIPNGPETASERFSSTRRWTLKKIRSKKFNFFWSKFIFKKKVPKKSNIFLIFQNVGNFNIFEKSNFSKMLKFPTFWKIKRIFDFFRNFFFENIFRSEKIKKNRSDFFQVHLLVKENRFEAVSRRFRQLKTRNSNEKKCWSYKFEQILLSEQCMRPRGLGPRHEKIEEQIFPTIFFVTNKKYFFETFFSNIKSYISASKCATLHGQRIILREMAHEKVDRPPLTPRLKSPSSHIDYLPAKHSQTALEVD